MVNCQQLKNRFRSLNFTALSRCIKLKFDAPTALLHGLCMTENPYQSPPPGPDESEPSEHNSFRLTSSSASPDSNIVIGTFRDAIKFSLIQQLPLLLIASLLLDGGLIFKRVGIASVAFWTFTLIIMIRRGHNMTDDDLLLIKWGYLPLLLVTCILWVIASYF
ncbi:MAG: hypothetical protein COA78_23770 [Blastopirellula sp.]|nr:MAG: hypothetical protein COA78_23770 [Blastopirellula sp.]